MKTDLSHQEGVTMGEKIGINPGWKYYKNLTYSPAVRKGNMLFIGGQDAAQTDPNTGKLTFSKDILEQMKVIYEKFKEILEAANAGFEDVVSTTDYITTTENYKATAEVRRQYFGDSLPASTGVIVKGLLHKGALIEIDAIAILDR